MLKRPLFTLFFSFLFLGCASSTPPVSTENAPVNPYADLEKKIAAIQADSEMPALKVQILERSDITYNYSQGVRTTDNVTPIAPKDKFALGTSTKVMTALLIAELVDLKVLDWDTPLKSLIPRDIPFNVSHKDTTLKMLLSQSSGFADVKDLQNKKLYPQLFNVKSIKDARERVVKAILAAPARFTPGTKNDNSSLSAFVVLGWVLQNKTNFTWEDLVKNKIFIHLNLDECGFSPDGAAPENAGFPQALNPAGGVYCSIDDWNKFLNLLSQGFFRESTLLKEETFSALFSNVGDKGFTFSGLERYDRTWANGAALALSGTHPQFLNFTAMAPSREMVFTVFTNSTTKKAEQGAAKIIRLLVAEADKSRSK